MKVSDLDTSGFKSHLHWCKCNVVGKPVGRIYWSWMTRKFPPRCVPNRSAQRVHQKAHARMCTAVWQFKSPDLDATQTHIAFAFSCCIMNGHKISGSKRHTLLIHSFCESGIWALLQNLRKLSQVSAGQWSHSKVQLGKGLPLSSSASNVVIVRV